MTNVLRSQQSPLDSPAVPLYARIREELRSQILAGTFGVHERMPSESELMRRYDVSRITVRQALGELQKERVIFRVPGKGSFVAAPKPFQELGRLQGFAEAMARHGYETWNRVLGIRVLAADDLLAGRLGVEEGEALTEIRRVRHLERTPVSLDVTYVRHKLGERLAREDLATRDIFLILENDYGIALGHADLAIDAVLADAAVGDALGLPAGAPILRIERLTCAADGTPLDFEYLYCRADNFQFRLRLSRNVSGSLSCNLSGTDNA